MEEKLTNYMSTGGGGLKGGLNIPGGNITSSTPSLSFLEASLNL